MCGVFPYRKGRGSRDESYCFTKGMKEAREGWTKLGKKRYNYLPSIFHSLKNRGDSTGNVRQHFCRIWNIHSWNIKQMLASNNKKTVVILKYLFAILENSGIATEKSCPVSEISSIRWHLTGSRNKLNDRRTNGIWQ